MESDEQLTQRYHALKQKYEKAKQSAQSCKRSAERDRKMRWAGSLNFLLIQAEADMEDRGLDIHATNQQK